MALPIIEAELFIEETEDGYIVDINGVRTAVADPDQILEVVDAYVIFALDYTKTEKEHG